MPARSGSQRRELLTLCAHFEAKNEKLLGRLPPELWQKIVDQNDLLALAMTCRLFRDTTKDLGKMETNLGEDHLLKLQKTGKMAPHTLGWFRWVCDTFEILPGEPPHMRSRGAVYEGDLVNYAVCLGSVEILRWLVEEKGWEANQFTGFWAGMGGSVEVFWYLVRMNEGEFWGDECEGAARAGRLETLKWLRRQGCPRSSWRTATYAMDEGHLDILKWLCAEDPPCPLNEGACAEAASAGQLEVLKWLRERDPPSPWDEGTCGWAVLKGQLEALKWLRAQNPPCPWSRDECREYASKYGYQHILEWIDQQEN